MSTENDTPLVEVMDGNAALMAVDRAQIDIQISTARAYPRDISRCQKDAMALATMDEETAKTMFYAVPRDGKTIFGPSIRLAEVIANAWEHIRVESRVESMDDRFLTAVATAIDLQKNVAFRATVRRRITDKRGRRYSDDMIVTASNAASSIAMRNALFKVVPSAFFAGIYARCRQVAVGEAKSFNRFRDDYLGTLAKAGVPTQRILDFFGYEGIEAITAEDLITLKGAVTAIKEGTLTVEEAFTKGDPEPNATELGVKAQPAPAATAPAEDPKPAPAAPQAPAGRDW